MSFNNEGHSTDMTHSKYVWEMKTKFKIMPSLKWSYNQIYNNVFKHFQKLSLVSARFEKIKILDTPILNNGLIKDQSLFQSAATLTSFYCRIIYLAIRPFEKYPIRII